MNNIHSKSILDMRAFHRIDINLYPLFVAVFEQQNISKAAQILCITHQAQVAAQSDQHLLVKKQQTDPASSTIYELGEDGRIQELARMTGGVEINETTLQHAKQLRQLKFQHSS